MDQGSVVLDRVSKTYRRGPSEVHALRDVSMRIDPGEFVVLLGPSGSGKTTLLNVLGTIEPPSAGTVTVSGIDVSDLRGADLTDYRRDQVGFVFQFFNLVPTLTASENVEVIAELVGADAQRRAAAALEGVGLGDRLDHFPAQLSGGEQQRVAVARALVKGAPVLLTDEPTGSLDLDSGKQVLGLLRRAADDGHTVVLVTHNSAIAQIADRVVELGDGQVRTDHRVAAPTPVEEVSW
ncbi:MAG: ABC transporter ATP-binding protein [Ilumatobacteraceae bacterium]|jgi:putative ABC transport system ATP-binding protein